MKDLYIARISKGVGLVFYGKTGRKAPLATGVLKWSFTLCLCGSIADTRDVYHEVLHINVCSTESCPKSHRNKLIWRITGVETSCSSGHTNCI